MLLLSLLSIINSPTVQNLVKDTYFGFSGHESLIRVVHFFQHNCPACEDVENVFEEVSRMYHQEKRIEFAQLNCDRATDVCDSSAARDFPTWFVWFQGQSMPKRFNRNFEIEQFVKFIRQGSGIRPTANENNLLYLSPIEAGNMTKKATCNFVILDKPTDPESQALHMEARLAEQSVKRGAKFFAVDKDDDAQYGKRLDGRKFGAFMVKNNKWTAFNGKLEKVEILNFLKEQKCTLSIATPTPTPVPLPELDDVEDDYFREEEKVDSRIKSKRDDEDDDEDDEETDVKVKKINDDFEEDSDFSFKDEDYDFSD